MNPENVTRLLNIATKVNEMAKTAGNIQLDDQAHSTVTSHLDNAENVINLLSESLNLFGGNNG